MREDVAATSNSEWVWIQAGSQDNNNLSKMAAVPIYAGGQPKQHFQERKDTFAF